MATITNFYGVFKCRHCGAITQTEKIFNGEKDAAKLLETNIWHVCSSEVTGVSDFIGVKKVLG